MHRVGFFADLPHGYPDGEVLAERIGSGDVAAQAGLVGYLTKGSVASMGRAVPTIGQNLFDVLSPERTPIGPLNVLTDGVWVWPSDLAYYVRVYNVGLPAEFVEWARLLDWVPPPVDEFTSKSTAAELLLFEALPEAVKPDVPVREALSEVTWDTEDVLLTIPHPFGTLELSLTAWMRHGPGPREFLSPESARSRSTGQSLPLTVVPLAYRNTKVSRALIAAGKIRSPWPPP